VREGEAVEAALLRFLASRHLLLVLDNLEHLVEGAPLVAELIGACPELTVLATSREPTRLSAERLYPVYRLDVPAASPPASSVALERYGAVAMFCDRATARDPSFALTEVNAPHVREICRRLDGLPLALELAAARCGLLSAAELAARLDRALAVLVGGARDAPKRQRTLRATIDWSYNLLTSKERRAFAHMAVFAGGATVAAAEAITGASLDTLDSLVAKQLVAHRDERLVMLETLREYALERLAEDPDADAVELRLAEWCREFAREATPHLPQADRVTWLTRLDAEFPNILAALSWAREQRRSELLLELLGEIGDYWWHTNRWHEGLTWFNAALEHTPSAYDHARAKALPYRARLTDAHQSYEELRGDLEASLSLFRACDDAVESPPASATWPLSRRGAVASSWPRRSPLTRSYFEDVFVRVPGRRSVFRSNRAPPPGTCAHTSGRRRVWLRLRVARTSHARCSTLRRTAVSAASRQRTSWCCSLPRRLSLDPPIGWLGDVKLVAPRPGDGVRPSLGR